MVWLVRDGEVQPGLDRSPAVLEMGLWKDISKAWSSSWPGLGLELGLGLGCSAGHGTLSPAWGPLTQSSEAVKC